MELRKLLYLGAQTHPPARQDRLIVLLMSAGIFLLLLPLARNIHPQVLGWIVMVIVLGLPVVTINVLLPFRRKHHERVHRMACYPTSCGVGQRPPHLPPLPYAEDEVKALRWEQDICVDTDPSITPNQ